MDKTETSLANSHLVRRLGPAAGWLTLLGIVVFELVGPGIVAGQRVSGTADVARIAAYYGHAALAPLSAGVFLVAAAFLVFAVTLREAMSDNPRSRFWSTLAAGFGIAAAPLYIAKSAAAITIVTIARERGDVLPFFRFWDVLYNSGIYVLEVGWIGAFGLAMRASPKFPRWLTWFSLGVAGMQMVNVTALFVGIPDPATIPANVGLMVWFAATNVTLARAPA